MVFVSQDLNAQVDLTWDHLADVQFEEKYDKEIDGYGLIPTFGEKLKSYENELVSIKGYLISLDLDYSVIALSKNPFSACFFCGMAGPETVIELELLEKVDFIKPDQKAIIRGKLILNDSDYNHFNYILKNATIELVD